jgi:hypothetical protein
MSTAEDLREDAKRERWEEKYGSLEPDEDCEVCGERAWKFLGDDPQYGADADGRRGTRLTEWECQCGQLLSLIG